MTKPLNKTRHDYQLPRRALHMFNGCMVALVYQLFLTHQQAVYILGTGACVYYILDQIRIKYRIY